jgi:hypothetical protein
MSDHGAVNGQLLAESDGLWPPGGGTGVPCQVALVRGADAAAGQGFFKATIAALRATLIEACRSAKTVHTTWLTWLGTAC